MFSLTDICRGALEEDAPSGDITSRYFVPQDIDIEAKIVAKENGIYFGSDIIQCMCKLAPSPITFELLVENGEAVTPGSVICVLRGKMKSLLYIERVLLNFLQRLSGIASTTSAFVDALDNASIAVMDTRKTTPLIRHLERQAVLAGGGINHRFGLSDMVLIKENHLTSFLASKSSTELPDTFRQFKEENPNTNIEIEIENLDQLTQWDLREVDIIMLDNFTLSDIRKAIEICQAKAYKADIEISGNVTLDTIGQYRDLAIQRISVGSLTHSVKAFDLSMIFFPQQC